MTQVSLLSTLHENDSITVKGKASTWQEAITLCFAPLIKSKAIEKSYVEAVIASTLANGPYYILDEHVAMPHARPEDGANRNAFSLVTLTQPVRFHPDQRDIYMLIGLSATSAEIHVADALPQIAALLEDRERQKEMLHATSKEEIVKIIQNADLNKYLTKGEE